MLLATPGACSTTQTQTGNDREAVLCVDYKRGSASVYKSIGKAKWHKHEKGLVTTNDIHQKGSNDC